MKHTMTRWLLFAGLLLALPFHVHAEVVDSGNVKAELLSTHDSVAPGQTFHLLMRHEIREHWHTYWVNPGDSGARTELTWTTPEGVEVADFEWPFPERIAYGPLMNYGYHDVVLYPMEVSVPENFSGDTLMLSAKGEWLVCADICIPEDATLEITVLVGNHIPNEANLALLEAARHKIPREMNVASEVAVQDTGVELLISLSGLDESRIKEVSYFPYTEGLIDNPTEQVWSLTEGGILLTTATGYDYSPSSTFDGIIVVTEDAGEELQTAFVISPEPGTGMMQQDGDGLSLGLAILFAFLGGMILNLMPCVFPVLSIKVLSLVKDSHNGLRHGMVYTAGVVLSFVVIAGILIGLRAGGAEIGWGFQLQSPFVVSVLVYLFFLVGLNLSGFFEVGGSLMGFGDKLASKQGYSGSFYTGVLATTVAAPCTAPFMASAIGFALTQSSFAALLVFAALGLGMAVPFLVLSSSPKLLSKLPKPGPWMVRFKEFLAFPLYGSAVWLFWVLAQQVGYDGVLMTGSGLVILVFAIWLVKAAGAGRIAQGIAVLLAAFALYLPLLLNPLPTSLTTGEGGQVVQTGPGPAWETFSPERLVSAREEGLVFVNFTAAWCITCKVNESVALATEETEALFTEFGITYLKGDWTNEDPVISRKLEEFGRNGVPLYLLYKADGSVEVLPQLLTQDIVNRAVRGAVSG